MATKPGGWLAFYELLRFAKPFLGTGGTGTMRAGEFWLCYDFAELLEMVAQLVLGPFAEFFAGIFCRHAWDKLYSWLTLIA